MSHMLSSFLSACPGAVSQGILWGVLALGIAITFRILNYADMTVDGSMCTGAAVSAVLLLKGVSPLTALFAAAAVGMLAGLLTGSLHTRLGIPVILSGILTQLGLYSINMRILGRSNLPLLGVEGLLSLRDPYHAILVGSVFALAMVGLLSWFFTTEQGYGIRATGSNAGMARAQGINTDSAIVLGLMISNGLVGLAGGLLAQYQGYADVNMGRGAIVIGLASLVLGEAVPFLRSRFSLKLFASIVGAILYYLVITLVLQAGLNTNDLKLLSALVVTVALGLPALRQKQAARRARSAALQKHAPEHKKETV